MTPHDILAALRAAGLSARAKGDSLMVKPPERITPELAETLRAHKEAVLALLTTPPDEVVDAMANRAWDDDPSPDTAGYDPGRIEYVIRESVILTAEGFPTVAMAADRLEMVRAHNEAARARAAKAAGDPMPKAARRAAAVATPDLFAAAPAAAPDAPPAACPFTEEESEAAYRRWGFNCGPAALAFAMRTNPEGVRGVIPGFEDRKYTSPAMMRAALEHFRRGFDVIDPNIPGVAFDARGALCRVQFTGPWTEPGASPKWASCHTHWVATWRQAGAAMVYDVNGGVMTFAAWQAEILPRITASIPRADGGWRFSHVWRLRRRADA